jgi:hypothetical protein
MKPNRITLFFATVLLSLVAFATANADPVSFNNVVGLPNASLASSPNILTVTPNINFSLDIHGAGAQSDAIQLQLSFHESGQSVLTQNFAAPIFDGLSDYTQLFNFQVQNLTFGGTPVTLTVSLVNTLSGAILQSQTYNFTVSQPVPEPATVTLLALGVVGLLSRKKRR